jgi:hypothetical protein
VSETVFMTRSIGDPPGDRRRPSPRAEYVSFGALLAEVLQDHADDVDVLGFARQPQTVESLRPKSAA